MLIINLMMWIGTDHPKNLSHPHQDRNHNHVMFADKDLVFVSESLSPLVKFVAM